MVVRVTMDLFQHRYYRLNKTIMMFIGQWPYQSACARRWFCAAIIYANTTELVSRILNIIKYRNNLSILFDCAVPFLTDLVCITNLIGFMSNSQKTLQLLDRIRADWQVWARRREITVLHEYTEQGQNINIPFTALICFTIFVFMTQPVIPKIIDVLLKNGTEPGKYPTHVEYYHIDPQKYYFYIVIYHSTMIVMILMVVTANNVMWVSYVQHACGIFAALGHKLTRITANNISIENEETAYVMKEKDLVHLAWCIDRHNDAIEYANLIEGMYTWNVFFTIVFGTILSNVLALQIFISTSNPEVAMRFICFVFALLFLFFVDCYTAQILMDHSLNIHFHIYNNKWYKLSCRAKKLLQLSMMRCTVPCQLTAGKILVLSLRTFGLTLRTAASYFMMLRSTQGL